MSGVITILAGTGTITASYLGVTANITVKVDALNPTTGQNVMGATASAVPAQWDAARVYTGDAQWHYNKFANSTPAVNDNYYFNPNSPTLGGQTQANALYKYGNSIAIDLASVVPSSIINGDPAFRFTWKSCTGVAGEGSVAGQPPSCQLFTVLATPTRRVWVGRRIAMLRAADFAGANKWDATGSECVNANSIAYNAGGTVANTFTITNAITVTGSQTVLVSSTVNIGTVNSLTVDTGGNAETLSSVIIVDATHITATFAKTHAAGVAVSCTYNGQGAGFKHGPYAMSTQVNSRSGVSGIVNCIINGSGNMEGGYQLDNGWTTGGGTSGFTDLSDTDSETVDFCWRDGKTYDEAVLMEQIPNGSGNYYGVTRFWRRTVSATYALGPWYRVGAYVTGAMLYSGTWYNSMTYNEVQFTSKNHNKAIEAHRYRDISEWAAFDATNPNADGSDDPWGCLAADNAGTPIVPTSNALASQTVSSGTFNVARGSASGVATLAIKLRPVIDGVDTPAQDYTVPLTYGDLDTVPVTVTLSTGAHTVAFKAVNGNGTIVSAASSSASVTI